MKENQADVDSILPDKLVSAFDDSVDALADKINRLEEVNEEAYQKASKAAEIEMEKLRQAWQGLADAFDKALKGYEETGDSLEKESSCSIKK